MTALLVGLDIGGTKTTARVETLDGALVVERSWPSVDWSAVPAAGAADWIVGHLDGIVPGSARLVAAGIGAQGCDTVALCEGLEWALGAVGVAATVVNDAALLPAAAGLPDAMAVIAGTGAIAVGRAGDGRQLFAGGWGWVLGDDASAPGIVRDATRAALLAHDDGVPDDGLLTALLAAFDVPEAAALARAVNDDPTPDQWGRRAPAVFAAADRGSHRARAVVDAGGAHLARLVRQLRQRGASGGDVVAAGSVISHQPRLFRAFKAHLARAEPSLTPHLLRVDPVVGAVAFARLRATTPAAPAVPGIGS